MSQTRSDIPYSLTDIVRALASDIQDLVFGEIALARAELDQKLHYLILAAVWVVGGALLSLAGLVVALEGIAAALALAIPSWAASLIVGIAAVVIGVALARRGVGLLSLKALLPTRAASNLRKDAQMIKEHT